MATHTGIQFYNDTSYLLVPNHNDIGNSGPYPMRTAETWIQTSSDISTYQCIYEEGGGASGYNFYLWDGYLWTGGWTTAGVMGPWLSYPAKASTSYRLGMRWDTDANEFSMWIDGLKVASEPVPGSLETHVGGIGAGRINANTRRPLTSGTSGTVQDPFVGFMGDLRLWSVSLAKQEMQARRDSHLTGSEAGLIVGYNLQEGSGDWAYDVGPLNHTADAETLAWDSVTYTPRGYVISEPDGIVHRDGLPNGNLTDVWLTA